MIARSPTELDPRRRAVAIGTFDGVHRGHRRALEQTVARAQQGDLVATVVTFDPHPRTALGNRVELLTTLDRRLELIGEVGVEDVLVVAFDLEVARLAPDEFARQVLAPIGATIVVAGENFRFGRSRSGDLETLSAFGFQVERVTLLEGVSSTEIRRLLAAGEVQAAAQLLGRPAEVEGTVVTGDARGGTLGFPTANLRVDPELLVPKYGIYAGAAADHRAAVSIGTNPHYGGHERRVEAYLLDFEGDLYGRRLVVELWQRLRDERAFDSEADLVAQIARDVEAARGADKPC